MLSWATAFMLIVSWKLLTNSDDSSPGSYMFNRVLDSTAEDSTAEDSTAEDSTAELYLTATFPTACGPW